MATTVHRFFMVNMSQLDEPAGPFLKTLFFFWEERKAEAGLVASLGLHLGEGYIWVLELMNYSLVLLKMMLYLGPYLRAFWGLFFYFF